MNLQNQTLLGIDYGSHHVGFAIKHEGTMTAVPLEIYDRGEGGMLEELIDVVAAKIKEHEVQVVVVGMPFTLQGKPGPQADKTALFIHRLHKTVVIPVYENDERMTSKAVPRGAHDQAATLILQSYIDRNTDQES